MKNLILTAAILISTALSAQSEMSITESKSSLHMETGKITQFGDWYASTKYYPEDSSYIITYKDVTYQHNMFIDGIYLEKSQYDEIMSTLPEVMKQKEEVTMRIPLRLPDNQTLVITTHYSGKAQFKIESEWKPTTYSLYFTLKQLGRLTGNKFK